MMGASLYLDDISVEETPTAPNCVENVSPTGTDVSLPMTELLLHGMHLHRGKHLLDTKFFGVIHQVI